ncbi:hypothetical protein KBD71_03275 [Candidatus Woesebacteria bacterium]|nr:hypothetical protein [Candidatus Woesebacteria bacterium]
MCWSASASIAATVIGTVGTIYAAKKGYPKAQVFTLGFFTAMELLQAISYGWIGQCSANENTILTYLSYLHICFQPVVMNAFMLSFLSKEKRQKWFRVTMSISIMASVLLFLKFFIPIVWTIPQELLCRIGDPLCGTDVCTYRGNWHLAWRLPLFGPIPGYLLYFTPLFILPIFYGSWKTSLYHFFTGPVLAHLLTTDKNEAPAIWCLFSVSLLCFMLFAKKKSKVTSKAVHN